MKMVLNDEILGRLVSYEKYVKRCFVQLARRRWMDFSAEAKQEYKQAENFKCYISAIVDLAFHRYGIEAGVMKSVPLQQDLALDKDLESLVAQLNLTSQGFRYPSHEREFAQVV